MSAPASAHAFLPMPPDDQFQRAPSSARAAPISDCLMERDSFSMDIISNELDLRTQPGSLVELPLTPSVYVLYAGIPEVPISSEDDAFGGDWFCCSAPEASQGTKWVQKTFQRHDTWLKLGTEMYAMTKRAIDKFKRRKELNFGVTLQAAVPGMPILGFPFVLHHILESSSERSTGNLKFLRVLLVFFDFFTASEGSGGAAVATRSIKLNVEPDFQAPEGSSGHTQHPTFKHLSHLEFKVHFGVKQASVIRETLVMKMLQPSGSDNVNDMLNIISGRRSRLKKQLVNLNKTLFPGQQVRSDEYVESIFVAAAVCLWAKDYQQPEPILQFLMNLLDYAELDLVSESVRAGVFHAREGASSPFEVLGMDLYECAVQKMLDRMNSVELSSATSAPPGKTFTIVEVPSCAPLGLQRPGASPTPYPAAPGNFGVSASTNEAIRVKMAHLVTEWRCREHLKWDGHPCPSLEADVRMNLRSIFEQCDLHRDDRLNKTALLNMANLPDVADFFKIPPGSDIELFFEDISEEGPAGTEATTWDDFKEFYVSKCLENVSSCSEDKSQWTELTRAALSEVIRTNDAPLTVTSSNGAANLERWKCVLKKSREDTNREEKECAHFISANGQHWRALAAGTSNEHWKEYCHAKAKMHHRPHPDEDDEVTTPAFDDMIELLAECEDVLFLKVAYATRYPSQNSGPGSNIPLPAQLFLLDLPVIEQVWQKLFPIKASLRQAEVQQLHAARLHEFADFVCPPGSSMVCLSQQAATIWKRFVTSRNTPRNLPVPPSALAKRTPVEHREDSDDVRTSDLSQIPGGFHGGSCGATGIAPYLQPSTSSRTASRASAPALLRLSGIQRSSHQQLEAHAEQESPFLMPHSRPPAEPVVTANPDYLQARQLPQSPAPSARSSVSEELSAQRQQEVKGQPSDAQNGRRLTPSFNDVTTAASRNVELPSLLTASSRQQFQIGKPMIPQVRGQRRSALDDEKLIDSPDIDSPEVQEFLLNTMHQMRSEARNKSEAPKKNLEEVVDDDGMLWVKGATHESPRNLLGILDPWGGCQVANLREIDGSLRHYEDGFPLEDLSSIVKGSVMEGSDVQRLSASKYPHLLSIADAGNKLQVSVCKHVDPRSMIQGHVGDCWLIAAVAALCEFEKPIRDVFANCNAIQKNATGPYELMLHDPKRNFARVPVLINDEIPCFRHHMGWRPCFASTLSRDEKSVDVWPMLLEKGIAFLLGGYLNVNGNRAPLAWAIVTGEKQFCTYFPWDQEDDTWGEGQFKDLVNRPSESAYRPKGQQNKLQPDKVWGSLRLLDIDGKLMSCTFKPRQGGPRKADLGEADAGDGLLAGHAYSLIAVKELRGTHRLLQLRNPWADGHEWSGPWSDSSREWKLHKDIAEELEYGESNRKADGLFWMSWDDFRIRVKEIVYSEASFTHKYGVRLISAPAPAPVVEVLWSKAAASEVESAGLPPSLPDLWHNLQDCDPDKLQEDLTSYFDGFSDQDLSVKLKIFRSSDIKWVSASRVHKLLQYEEEAMPGDMTEEEQVMQRRWAEIAAQSGASSIEDAKLCSRIDVHIMQAHAGNSWLVAAIASLARFHKPIFDVFSPKSLYKGKDGPYQLSLHDPHQGWRKRIIKINDRVPCYAHYGNNRKRAAGWRPCYAAALYREVWPMLLEKGIAYLLGGYDKLDCNPPQVAWAILTGDLRYTTYFPWTTDESGMWGEGTCDLATRSQQYKYQPKELNCHAAEWAWDKIKHGAKDGKLMACTFQSFDHAVPNLDFAEAGYKDGLAANHTYVILTADSFLEENCSTVRGRRGRGGAGRTADRSVEHRLLCLKSPWAGDIGWCGRWSFDSPEWEQHPKVAEQLRRIQHECDYIHHDSIQDGVFWVDFAQFQENVQEVVISEKAYWRTLPQPPAPKVERTAMIQVERSEGFSDIEQVLLDQDEQQPSVRTTPEQPQHRETPPQSTPQTEGVYQPAHDEQPRVVKSLTFAKDARTNHPRVTHESEVAQMPAHQVHANGADVGHQYRDSQPQDDLQAPQFGNRTPSRSPCDEQHYRSTRSQRGGDTPSRSPCDEQQYRQTRQVAHQPDVDHHRERSCTAPCCHAAPQSEVAQPHRAQARAAQDEQQYEDIDPRPDAQPEGAAFASSRRFSFDGLHEQNHRNGPYADSALRNVAAPEPVDMTGLASNAQPNHFGRLNDQGLPSNMPGLQPQPTDQNYSVPYDALRIGANPGHLNSQPHPPDFLNQMHTAEPRQADMGYPVADASTQHLPPNTPVWYYNPNELGGPRWIPATVLRYSPFIGYTLDCKDGVDPSQLRTFSGDPVAPPPLASSPGEAPDWLLPPISVPAPQDFIHPNPGAPSMQAAAMHLGQAAGPAAQDFMHPNPGAPSIQAAAMNLGQPAGPAPQDFMHPNPGAPSMQAAALNLGVQSSFPPQDLPLPLPPAANQAGFFEFPLQELPPAPQSYVCNSCRKLLRAGALFCDSCGCAVQAAEAGVQVSGMLGQVLPEVPAQYGQPRTILPPPILNADVQPARSQPASQQNLQQEHAPTPLSMRESVQARLDEQRRQEHDQRNPPLSVSPAPGNRARAAAASGGSRSVENLSPRSSATSEITEPAVLPPAPPATVLRRRDTIEEHPAVQRSSRVPQADPEELRDNLRELASEAESERSEVYDPRGGNSGGEDDRQRSHNHTYPGVLYEQTLRDRRHAEERRQNTSFRFHRGMRVERTVPAAYDEGFSLQAGATGTITGWRDGQSRRVDVKWDATGTQRAFTAETDMRKLRPLEEDEEIVRGHNMEIVEQPNYDDLGVVGGAGAPAGPNGTRQAVTAGGSDSKNECSLYGHIDVMDETNFSRNMDRFKKSCQQAIAHYIGVNHDRVTISDPVVLRSRHRFDQLVAKYGEAELNRFGRTIHFEVKGGVLQSDGGPFALSIRKLREIQSELFQIYVPTGNHAVQVPEFFKRVQLLGTPFISTSLFTKNVDPFMGTTLSGTVSLSRIYAHRFVTLAPNADPPREQLRALCDTISGVLNGWGINAAGDIQVAYRSSTQVTRPGARGDHYKLEVEVSSPSNMMLEQVRQCLDQLEKQYWRIDSAILHEGTNLHRHGNRADWICAHVDIRTDNPRDGINNGAGTEGLQRQFEAAIRRLATHRGIADELDIDTYNIVKRTKEVKDEEITDTRGRKKKQEKKDKERRQQVWRIDFMVSINHGGGVCDRQVDMRAAQDLLWALNRKETKEWGKELPANQLNLDARQLNLDARAFFKDYSLESGVRICANELSADAQLTPNGPRCTFVAEIDIVDQKGFFENSGPLAFASLLSDALHVIAGIPAPRITILDAREKKTDKMPIHDEAKRYAVHVEVGFEEESPEKLQMQRVYDCMWHMHSELIRNRWTQLPFFKHYVVEGGVQVYYPDNVRSVVQEVGPQKSLPKIRAHIDVIDANAERETYLEQLGGSFRHLAQAFRSMLQETVGISEDCVKVICIRKRPVHLGRATFIKMIREDALHRKERKDYENGYAAPGRENVTERAEAQMYRAHADVNQVPLRAWEGYTFEFEVTAPSTATNERARTKELEEVKKKLRKLHSHAVWRKHTQGGLQQQVDFLQHFIFDIGIQIDFAMHPTFHVNKVDDRIEDHMHPEEAGPVIVYPSFQHNGDPYALQDRADTSDGRHRHVLIHAHVDICYKSEIDGVIIDEDYMEGAYAEEDIRKWFRDALDAQVRGHLETWPEVEVLHPEFIVIGVEKKAAHSLKLKEFYLGQGQHGVDKAQLQRTQGYTISFGLRCDADVPEEGRDLEDLRTRVYRILFHLRQWVVKSVEDPPNQELFSHFAFDHGVMIDASEQQGLATFSLSPLAIRAAMMMSKRGGSSNSSRSALEEVFPDGMAVALGTCAKQIRKVQVREGQDSSQAIVDFEVNTLTPNPAKQEYNSLLIKLQALQLQCLNQGRWWMELFPNWKVVSVHPGQQVATTYQEDKDADREGCDSDKEHEKFASDDDHW